MGCAASVGGGNHKQKKTPPPLVTILVPSIRIPLQSNIHKPLQGLVPKDLALRLASSRNQIALLAHHSPGDVSELLPALEEYSSLLVGLTDQELGLQQLIEFKWTSLDDRRQEICVADSWFELLSVVHMMAMLTLMDANSKLIPDQTLPTEAAAQSTDNIRCAVELLVKAAGYLQFCLREILVRIPPDIRMKLPVDFQENVLEAVYIQALGQGTEMQLASAVDSRNATLSVKRRLACEQLSYFGQAHYCLSTCVNTNGYVKKHMSFIKWKYLEAKAAAYYYHGLITDKGTEPSCHMDAVCCFLAAEELLAESKKACLKFCLTAPVTRVPSTWGAMKHLNKKIPETAAKKSQMYGYILEQEKGLEVLPELPVFELSLKAEEYEMPEKDGAWESET